MEQRNEIVTNATDQRPNYYDIHRAVVEMFPNLDWAHIFDDLGHMTTDGLASFIVEHIDRMPRQKKGKDQTQLQRRGTKRKAGNKDVQMADDDDSSDVDEMLSDLDEEIIGDLLLDKMFHEMSGTIRRESAIKRNQLSLGKLEEVAHLLQDQFTAIRSEFIKMMFRAFQGNVTCTALACFFCQGNYNHILRKALNCLMSDQFWEKHSTPMLNTRKKKTAKTFCPSVMEGYERYQSILSSYKQRYPELVSATNRLTLQAANIQWEREENEFECLVCFDKFPASRVLFCTDLIVPAPSPPMRDSDGIQAMPPLSSSSTTALWPTENLESNVKENFIVCNPELSSYDNDITFIAETGPSPKRMKMTIKPKDEEELQPGDLEIIDEVIINKSGRTGSDNSPEGSCISSDSIEIVEQYYPNRKQSSSQSPQSQLYNAIIDLENETYENEKEHRDDVMSYTNKKSESNIAQTVPNKSTYHTFCRACVRGSAEASDDAPLARGGQGLRCMVDGCENVLRFTDVRHLISKDLRKKLEDRIMEENVGMASIPNLERCRKCNYPLVIDDPVEVNKVFECFKCEAKTCRICGSDWNEDHFGITCDELDVKMKRDKRDREMERRMNEAILRKCPRCRVAFVKEAGCNKMTCRCGMKMCYICRATNITYEHFCPHYRDPKVKNWKCTQCAKTCLLHEDYQKHDERLIEQIRQEALHGQAGPSTSAAPSSSTNTQNLDVQPQQQLDANADPLLHYLAPPNFVLPARNRRGRHRHIRLQRANAPELINGDFQAFHDVNNRFHQVINRVHQRGREIGQQINVSAAQTAPNTLPQTQVFFPRQVTQNQNISGNHQTLQAYQLPTNTHQANDLVTERNSIPSQYYQPVYPPTQALPPPPHQQFGPSAAPRFDFAPVLAPIVNALHHISRDMARDNLPPNQNRPFNNPLNTGTNNNIIPPNQFLKANAGTTFSMNNSYPRHIPYPRPIPPFRYFQQPQYLYQQMPHQHQPLNHQPIVNSADQFQRIITFDGEQFDAMLNDALEVVREDIIGHAAIINNSINDNSHEPNLK